MQIKKDFSIFLSKCNDETIQNTERVRQRLSQIELKSNELIEEAIRASATDLHFIPLSKHFLLRHRINGRIANQLTISKPIAERLISHFKYKSGMDIGERRKPQSAAFTVHCLNESYSLRLSTLPSLRYESLAIRILPQARLITLAEIPLLPSFYTKLQQTSSFTQGLCLVTGPTNSGKTTTLYAILEYILQKK